MSKSLRGQFLISATHLRDSNFFKTVVLLLEHHKEGAMGVVINRPMDVTVPEALAKHFDFPDTSQRLYSGGPVDETALLVLHNEDSLADEVSSIVPQVNVGTSADIFESIAEALKTPHTTFRFRLFAGYSGWTKGQLETELKRGDWYVVPADTTYVFRESPYEVWEDLLKTMHSQTGVVTDRNQKHEWN